MLPELVPKMVPILAHKEVDPRTKGPDEIGDHAAVGLAAKARTTARRIFAIKPTSRQNLIFYLI